MFEKKDALAWQDEPAGDWSTRRAAELARVWRGVIFATLSLAAVWAAGMVGAGYALIRDFMAWHDALPAGVPITLELIAEDPPGVLLTSVLGRCGGIGPDGGRTRLAPLRPGAPTIGRRRR